MKTIYYKICKSITFLLSLFFCALCYAETYTEDIVIAQQGVNTTRRIYYNSVSQHDQQNLEDIVVNSKNDSNPVYRYSGYEGTDETYGEYTPTADMLQYANVAKANAVVYGMLGEISEAERGANYSTKAIDLARNYTVAQTTTYITVGEGGGNVQTNGQYILYNHITNVVNVIVTNVVASGGYDDTMVSNIWQMLYHEFGYDIQSNTGNKTLEYSLQLVNSTLHKIDLGISTLTNTLDNIDSTVTDIYNLQDNGFQNIDSQLEEIITVLWLLQSQTNIIDLSDLNITNIVDLTGLNITNLVDIGDEIAVTNTVNTTVANLLRKILWVNSWRSVPASSSNYWNFQNFTNENYIAKLSSLPLTIQRQYLSRLNSVVNPAFTVKINNPAVEWYSFDSLEDWLGDSSQVASEDYIPLLNYINNNWLLYYTYKYGGMISNQFEFANLNLSSISNNTQTIIGILTNLDFNVSNDFASIYADYTGKYDRVWHDIGDSLTNNASIFLSFRDDDPIEVYSNIVFNSENTTAYNWFERVEYLLWALVAGDGATNGWENTEEDTTRIYSISNEVESSMSGMLTSLKSRLDDVGATTNKVMQFFDNFKDIVTENARLEDVEIEWMPSSLASQQEVSTYLILPVTENEELRSLCDFIRNIMIAVWFLVFAWLGSNLGERVLKLSWRIIVLGYSFFQRILGSK